KFIQDLLRSHSGITLINKIDLKLRLILHHSRLKVFNLGLADFALFTASEYKNMMKIMLFVLESLIEEKKMSFLLIYSLIGTNILSIKAA
ncbi:16775_t:CDS:1, partial [Dentiscutata erythropus]